MHHVRHLLMGGQACVLYGAAEFSRDADLAIVADAENLQRFQTALDDLRAERIAVPSAEQIAFWLRELRTPLLLIDVAARFPDECRAAISERLLLEHAHLQDEA